MKTELSKVRSGNNANPEKEKRLHKITSHVPLQDSGEPAHFIISLIERDLQHSANFTPRGLVATCGRTARVKEDLEARKTSDTDKRDLTIPTIGNELSSDSSGNIHASSKCTSERISELPCRTPMAKTGISTPTSFGKVVQTKLEVIE